MSPFYFKFQFRNVEYSSGRNKTLLCFRVDTPGGTTEPLKGYMEDEHATAHAEEAFFQQVTFTNHMINSLCKSFCFVTINTHALYVAFLLKASIKSPLVLSQVLPNASQEYEVTWYVSSSPCVACATKVASILQQRKKLRLCIFCSRLFEWEQPEIAEGLRTLASAGCKVRMMRPTDFVHVWDTYVDKEDESFTPWEDCKENYEYYMERLADILK